MPMHTVTIAHAKNQLSSLIHAVESGEDVVLTRHGKPVARLIAEPSGHPAQTDAELDAQALAILDSARAKFRLAPRFEDWKVCLEEGRRF